MSKSDTAFLRYIKDQGRQPDLPLNVLRQFQEFEKSVHSQMSSYDEFPAPVAYGMRCFSKLEMFGMALAMSGEHSAAERCLNHLMHEFNSDSAFADGVTLHSWFLFNFPFTHGGHSIASEVLRKTPEFLDELGPFVAEAIQSRLGLYEVKKSTRDSCLLRELFTDQEILLNQPLETPPGNIALIRVMNVMGDQYAFGDTNEFPAERKSTIQGMIAQKMIAYFPENDARKSYESMMRLAGPYWFSIVARDYQGDILAPDHYLSYYNGGKSK